MQRRIPSVNIFDLQINIFYSRLAPIWMVIVGATAGALGWV